MKAKVTETNTQLNSSKLSRVEYLHNLDEILSTIANEINQPLATISLFAQSGKRMLEAGKYEQVSLLFDKLSQQVLRAGAVIEKLQLSYNSQQNHKQSIDGRTLPKYYVKQITGTSIVYNDDRVGVTIYFTLPAQTRER